MSKSTTYTINVKSKGVKKADKNIKKLKTSVNGLGKAAIGLTVAFGVYKLGGALINLGKSSIDTAGKFETLRVRLNNMYGSVQRGGQAFDTFNKIAATTPFQLQNVVEAGASLKAFGVDAEQMIKPLSDLAAFMGTDIVEASSALGRAFAGGSGAADVFREKGILQLIRDSQGIADLTKLTLPEFRDAMVKTLADPNTGIAGATDKLSKTWQGTVSNFKDGIDRMKDAIGKKLIEKIQPMIEEINGEFSKIGDVGWENFGEALFENWNVVFGALADIFIEAGVLLGKSLMAGISGSVADGYVQVIDEIIAGAMNMLNAFNEFIGWNDVLRDRGYRIKAGEEFKAGESWVGEAAIKDLKDTFEKDVKKILDDLKGTMNFLVEETEKISEEKNQELQDKLIDFPRIGQQGIFDESWESPFVMGYQKEPTQKFISILEAEEQEIRNSFNKQYQAYLDAGVDIEEADTWRYNQIQKALEEHNNKMKQIKENQRIDDLENSINVQTVADYELELFKINLEKKREAYIDAGMSEIEFEKWKAEEIKKFKDSQIEADIDYINASSDIVGRMAQLNETMKGDAKTTAKLQMLQALIDAYSAANSALASPPKGYGATPVGFAVAGLALAQGIAHAGAINTNMQRMAEGGSFITNGAMPIMVGDNPSGRERVEVTPLDAVGNPTAGGGGGVNVTFTGNVMSEDFIENEAIPQIKEAIRRGADIGIG